MAKYIMALDAGTTSNRCILFDRQGRMCSSAQKEFTQFFPKPGWVEHDAEEIWSTQLEVAQEAMKNLGVTAADIAAIGITNQRETTIVWDADTGRPICNAIVWQCRRTADRIERLRRAGRSGPAPPPGRCPAGRDGRSAGSGPMRGGRPHPPEGGRQRSSCSRTAGRRPRSPERGRAGTGPGPAGIVLRL